MKKAGKLQVPQIVKECTDEYRKEVDPIAGFILDRCCVEAGNRFEYETFSALWGAYDSWARVNRIQYPVSQRVFTKSLKALSLESDKDATGSRIYRGISLERA